ncbi:hypothetical protein [Kitasatospora purpeofusca]|uniref:hypothetical protein n=1 Tax=Kitasatospora purpeofusca TaxID=67352 RepID=UPI0036D26BBD
MADNEHDPAGSTQMFRAFVEETPAPQAPGSVNTYGGNNGNRTGKIAVIAVVALAVLGAVIWLAVK